MLRPLETMLCAPSIRRRSLLLAACLGLSLGACQEDAEDRIVDTCRSYCERSVECNPTTIDLDVCTGYCESVLRECPSGDRQERAIDGYDACASEACGALLDCSFEAEQECGD